MGEIVGIILGFVVWGFTWKVLGNRLKMAKEKIWGLTIAIGLAVALLSGAYSLGIMTNPLVLLIIPGVIFAYIVNVTAYRADKLKKKAEKNKTVSSWRLEDQKDKQLRKENIPRRNELCTCGSGLKYKYCCGKSK